MLRKGLRAFHRIPKETSKALQKTELMEVVEGLGSKMPRLTLLATELILKSRARDHLGGAVPTSSPPLSGSESRCLQTQSRVESTVTKQRP